MTRKEKAIEIYKQRFNCSQAVFTAYCNDNEIGEKAALRLATVFGAGVACTGTGNCGAVTGALMAISMKYGKDDPEGNDAKIKTYGLARDFMKRFEEANGSLNCEKILGLNIGSPEGMQKAQAAGMFETRCLEMVKSAADLLDLIL
jgi:C_GCAxxG_C_C family probable redox protein